MAGGCIKVVQKSWGLIVAGLTGDGAATNVRFMSPFGLAIHSNVFVVAERLKSLLAVVVAFGTKVGLRGETTNVLPPALNECLP